MGMRKMEWYEILGWGLLVMLAILMILKVLNVIQMKELKSLKIGLLIFVFMVIVYSYLTTIGTGCLDKFSISLSLFALFYEAILVVVEK